MSLRIWISQCLCVTRNQQCPDVFAVDTTGLNPVQTESRRRQSNAAKDVDFLWHFAQSDRAVHHSPFRGGNRVKHICRIEANRRVQKSQEETIKIVLVSFLPKDFLLLAPKIFYCWRWWHEILECFAAETQLLMSHG